MSNELPINIIYAFNAEDVMNSIKGNYEIIIAFSESSRIGASVLEDTFKKIHPERIGKISLNTLTELEEFALQITKTVKAPAAILLSDSDYNRAIETVTDIASFKDILSKLGHTIKNPDYKAGSAIWEKIFS